MWGKNRIEGFDFFSSFFNHRPFSSFLVNDFFNLIHNFLFNHILRYFLHNKVAQNTQDERVWDIFFTTLFNDYIGTNIEIIFTINIHTINMNLSIKHYNQK